MADPKLKLGNDIWATKQKSLLAYNDEGGNFKSLPFQVDRISGGTYVGRNGLIQTAASNEPRIDFLNNTKGALLLEPQRTNQFTNSENLSNIDFQTNSTITTDNIISPNGSLTADKTTQTIGGYLRETISVSNGTTYSFSVFLKKGDLRYAILRSLFSINGITPANGNCVFDLDNGTVIYTGIDVVSASIEAYANDWYRCSFVSIASGTNSAPFIDFYFTSSSSSTQSSGTAGYGYAWGMQLEAGTYSTSTIPTSSAAVTRNAETVGYDHFPADFINSNEGTLFVDFEYLFQTTSSSSTDSLRDIMVLGTSSDISEGISIDNYRSQFRVFVQGSGMGALSIGNNSTGAAQPNTRYKLAVKYKTGDCKAYLNGTLLGSSTGTVNFVTDLDGFFFSYNDSSRSFKNQKHVYNLQYFDNALSDAELATLTKL